MLSEVVGYEFGDSDWLAVSTALPGTDDERAEGWYCYPLVGRSEVQVRLAQAVGSGVVSVEIGYAADDRLVVAVPLLLDVFARYRVLPEGGRL
ncbi:hypothetical protein [Thermomonospora cellulosilytica]|uniref:Uncharacterized protein n=1 Tax=Thermomonospora cellulosilytica TaxID=1411118 RepID=A0A7W3R6I8_9ACTN|nr:hypothetical protein [Thermomonospora cellulosilytica]MBA9001395.1 hypothetical protein [Thermomonospora cellulosilytica]